MDSDEDQTFMLAPLAFDQIEPYQFEPRKSKAKKKQLEVSLNVSLMAMYV